MDKKSPNELVWRASTPGHFTGEVRMAELNEPVPGGPRVLVVEFEAGARTNWHSHAGGQVLHILSGKGFVADSVGHRLEVAAGDVISVPPGELHWHGATKDGPMSHLSVTDAPADWSHGDVTDAEYSVS